MADSGGSTLEAVDIVALLKLLPVRGYQGGLDRLEKALSVSPDPGVITAAEP